MLELERNTKTNGMYSCNPFREMDSFRRAFDSSLCPDIKCDIRDTGDSYELEADLPGYKKENISVEADGDLLTISAQRNDEKEEKSKSGKYVRYERTASAVRRSFDISEVNADEIAVAYEDGVLKLTLPKKKPEQSASKKFEIK